LIFERGKINYMKYLIILHKSKYGYDIHVPALPGCHSQGATEKEALNNIQDAILTYLGMEKEELKGAKVREIEVALV
jgi:predicted RNase H-like HicB family nuclease